MQEPDPEAAYTDFVNSYIRTSSIENLTELQNSPLECVIVEPRRHPALEGVLHNFAYFLPNARFTLYHSTENADFVQNIVNDAPIKLVNFREGNMGREDYNELLKSPEFWGDRAAERTLIFQTDTGILKNSVARFWKYAYVGAPWTWSELGDPFFRVGNGGLSLRDTAFCLEAAKDTGESKLPEDVYFAYRALYAQRSPSVDLASSFSMEYLDHPDPMGFHQAYRLAVHTPERQKSLLRHYGGDGKALTRPRVVDAWIENSRDGRVYDIPNMVNCLNIAVGPSELHIPKGSRMWDKHLDNGSIVTQSKNLVMKWISCQGNFMQTSCILDPKLCLVGNCFLR
jgi:hypothetical protein